nr:hypothetical protein [Tanacetum cinerariifolium]
DTVKFDYLDEFYGPFIHIHILEEERIRREHADYINRMEMLFTINPRPHPSTYANMNVESFSSLPIPIQGSDPHQEEIDVVTIADDVLPPSVDNDDSDGEEVDRCKYGFPSGGQDGNTQKNARVARSIWNNTWVAQSINGVFQGKMINQRSGHRMQAYLHNRHCLGYATGFWGFEIGEHASWGGLTNMDQ